MNEDKKVYSQPPQSHVVGSSEEKNRAIYKAWGKMVRTYPEGVKDGYLGDLVCEATDESAAKKIAAALNTPPSLPAENVVGWQPMETAPKNGKHCILAIKSGAFVYSIQGSFANGKWLNAADIDSEPLAWMPNVRLPAEFCPWADAFKDRAALSAPQVRDGDETDLVKELRKCDEILDCLRFAGIDQNPHGIRDLLSSAIENAARNYAAIHDALRAADGLLQELGYSLPQVKNTLANPKYPWVSENDIHHDDLAVDRFAAAMKAKLAKKRSKGYGGWDDPEDCSIGWLSELLRKHVGKGDPVDVGNFAMMIHQRGGVIE